MKSGRQLRFRFRTWGGKRKNAGRKRTGDRPCVAHRTRPSISVHTPVHVTIRFRAGLPTLRNEAVLKELRNVLVYVLLNFRHHARSTAAGWDLASSAVAFDGWRDVDPRANVDSDTYALIETTRVPPDRCWLLKSGWKRYGLIRSTESPGQS